jgi:hypothetical protein
MRSAPTITASMPPRRQQQAGGVVGDDGVRHTVLAKFPGGQQALVARTRFGNPDVDVDSLIERRIHRRQRGAVVDGRQPAGVAVGHHFEPARRPGRRSKWQPVVADAAALLDVLGCISHTDVWRGGKGTTFVGKETSFR